MRLLLDQDVYAATARFLAALGHDVAVAGELSSAPGSDADILAAARRDARILVTRDRDFGALVFLRQLGTGVLYLRLTPATLGATHEQLARVLASYGEEELRRAFVTVEPGRHRYRRLPATDR
jgi:predicted nuclease of predicted toxin-antitoxin system